MAGLTRLSATVAIAAVLVMAAAPAAAAASLLPEMKANGQPISRYEIWYDPGGFADVAPKVIGLFTDLTFGACRLLVTIATWLITWAYSFGFADALSRPAARLAGAYETRVIGPLQLRHVALFAAVVYAGFHALRGRLAHGAGELAISLAILGSSTFILAQPEALFRAGVRLTAGLSAAVLELASDPATVARGPQTGTLTDGLLDAFLVQPHDILNWGETLTGSCAEQRDQVLASGPHGTEDRPRELMREGGTACEPYADFNAAPTVERLMGAGLVLLAALLVLACMGLVAATVSVAQLVAVALIGWTPFALAAGVLPGGGRQLLWRWVAAALRCGVTVMAMSGLLTFMLVTSQALLSDAQQTLLERFGLLVMLSAASLVMRRRVVATSRRVTGRLSRRLESARVGGSRGAAWLGAAAAGGISGFGFGHLVTEGRQELRGVTRSPLTYTLANSWLYRRRGVGASAPAGTPADSTSTGRVATAARLAANLTVNLPRSAPRALARSVVTSQQRADDARQRLTQARVAAGEWRHGLAHPIDAYRSERARLIATQGATRRASAAHAQLRALSQRGPLEEGQ